MYLDKCPDRPIDPPDPIEYDCASLYCSICDCEAIIEAEDPDQTDLQEQIEMTLVDNGISVEYATCYECGCKYLDFLNYQGLNNYPFIDSIDVFSLDKYLSSEAVQFNQEITDMFIKPVVKKIQKQNKEKREPVAK